MAIGLVFFGRPEIALLIGLGALLPDLDREYWFVPAKQYRDEQPHRALLHNVFIMALTYIASPFLSLGVFLHVLQDSFTTVKDRGVEWFYPLTRAVKKGLYDATGKSIPTDPKERVYFYQEDLNGLTENSDPDLRLPGNDSVPWRRVYGFAQNSQILDRGFLLASIAILIVWLFVPTASNLYSLADNIMTNWELWIAGYGSVGVLYFAGEMDRRDKVPKFRALQGIKKPTFVAGLAVLVVWLGLDLPMIASNVQGIFARPAPLLAGIAAVMVGGYLALLWKTRQKPAVV